MEGILILAQTQYHDREELGGGATTTVGYQNLYRGGKALRAHSDKKRKCHVNIAITTPELGS